MSLRKSIPYLPFGFAAVVCLLAIVLNQDPKAKPQPLVVSERSACTSERVSSLFNELMEIEGERRALGIMQLKETKLYIETGVFNPSEVVIETFITNSNRHSSTTLALERCFQ